MRPTRAQPRQHGTHTKRPACITVVDSNRRWLDRVAGKPRGTPTVHQHALCMRAALRPSTAHTRTRPRNANTDVPRRTMHRTAGRHPPPTHATRPPVAPSHRSLLSSPSRLQFACACNSFQACVPSAALRLRCSTPPLSARWDRASSAPIATRTLPAAVPPARLSSRLLLDALVFVGDVASCNARTTRCSRSRSSRRARPPAAPQPLLVHHPPRACAARSRPRVLTARRRSTLGIRCLLLRRPERSTRFGPLL